MPEIERELDRVERSDVIIVPGKNIGVGWEAEDIASEDNRWHLSDHTRVSDIAAIIEYKKARKRGLSPKLILTSGTTARGRKGDTTTEFNESHLMKAHIQTIAPSIPDEAFVMEDLSRDTAENAEKVAQIVREHDLRTASLITVGFHTDRAEMLFNGARVPLTSVVASEDIMEQKFPRFVKNYKENPKYHYREETQKEKKAMKIQSIPVLGRLASEFVRRTRSGKVVEIKSRSEVVQEESARQSEQEYNLMYEYKRGRERNYRTFDEVYWRREAADGTVYIKRMTPDGKVTAIEDNHGKITIGNYDMNELVVPVPNRFRSILGIFKPKNWKVMRNHEYLEETHLKVGQVASDGTKVTEINVVRNKLVVGQSPDGLIGDFRKLLKKAGNLKGELLLEAIDYREQAPTEQVAGEPIASPAEPVLQPLVEEESQTPTAAPQELTPEAQDVFVAPEPPEQPAAEVENEAIGQPEAGDREVQSTLWEDEAFQNQSENHAPENPPASQGHGEGEGEAANERYRIFRKA